MMALSVRKSIKFLTDNKRQASAVILMYLIYLIGESWRLWENGYFSNYKTCWIHINPIDESHPNGIYFWEMKWNIKKISEEIKWAIAAIIFILGFWKDKWMLLFCYEFLAWTIFDLCLWFYNFKTDFYSLNFIMVGIVSAILWYLTVYRKRQANLQL